MATNVGDFFIGSNSVYNITDEDYQKINLLINSAKAFARSTHQCVYIIDYFKQNFLYVSGGNADADSTELLDNPKMKELIDSLKDKAEYVILDSAPIGLLADAGILAQYVDGIVLVVKKDFARADFILNCLEQFAEHNVHIIGCVLNDD